MCHVREPAHKLLASAACAMHHKVTECERQVANRRVVVCTVDHVFACEVQQVSVRDGSWKTARRFKKQVVFFFLNIHIYIDIYSFFFYSYLVYHLRKDGCCIQHM